MGNFRSKIEKSNELSQAIVDRNFLLVNRLIDSGKSDVQFIDRDGNTPLILLMKAFIDEQNKDYFYLIDNSIFHLLQIYSNTCLPGYYNLNGETAFMIYMSKNGINHISTIFRFLSDYNEVWININKQNIEGKTALMNALEHQTDNEILWTIIYNKLTNLDLCDNNKNTVLMYAVYNDKSTAAESILGKSPKSIGQINVYGESALSLVDKKSNLYKRIYGIIEKIDKTCPVDLPRNYNISEFSNFNNLHSKGGYNNVFPVLLKNETKFLKKYLPFEKSKNIAKANSIKEVIFLKKMNEVYDCKTVVKMNGICYNENVFAIVLEPLILNITKFKKVYLQLELEEKVQYFYDIFKKITRDIYNLHCLGILHNNLIEQNIMMDDNNKIKIIDFTNSFLLLYSPYTLENRYGKDITLFANILLNIIFNKNDKYECDKDIYKIVGNEKIKLENNELITIKNYNRKFDLYDMLCKMLNMTITAKELLLIFKGDTISTAEEKKEKMHEIYSEYEIMNAKQELNYIEEIHDNYKNSVININKENNSNILFLYETFLNEEKNIDVIINSINSMNNAFLNIDEKNLSALFLSYIHIQTSIFTNNDISNTELFKDVNISQVNDIIFNNLLNTEINPINIHIEYIIIHLYKGKILLDHVGNIKKFIAKNIIKYCVFRRNEEKMNVNDLCYSLYLIYLENNNLKNELEFMNKKIDNYDSLKMFVNSKIPVDGDFKKLNDISS